MIAYATKPVHKCLRVRGKKKKLANKLKSTRETGKKNRRTCASGKTKAL